MDFNLIYQKNNLDYLQHLKKRKFSFRSRAKCTKCTECTVDMFSAKQVEYHERKYIITEGNRGIQRQIRLPIL
jgi:hypothetical protein